MRRMRGMAAAAALVMATATPALAETPAVDSTWQSDFGPMTLTVTEDGGLSGVYPDFDGRLVDGHVDFIMDAVQATWVQPTSEVRCETAVDGSHYWGRVTWQAAGADRLTGDWTYCDAILPGNNTWTARRTSPRPPPPPPADAVTETDLLQAQRAHFGRVPTAETQVVREDVTCDGAPDMVAGVLSEDVELGPYYDVMILSRSGIGPDESPVPEGVRLPFGDMLCGPVQAPELAVEVPEHMTAAEVVGWPGCVIQVHVIDGMCDIHRLLWLDGREPGGRLLYTRL